MSQENVEVVRRVYAAAARRDSAAVLALYDPEVELDLSRGPLKDLIGRDDTYHGHEGLRRFFRGWYEAWADPEADLEELINAGEHVISVETDRARGHASGIEVEVRYAAVWTIRGGKVVRVVAFPTREEALEAAGRSE